MHINGIQKDSLARLPLILKELYQLEKRNREVVSPAYLAEHLHQPEALVRTDLAAVGIAGNGEVAWNVLALIAAIEKMLGYQNNDVFVVGSERSATTLEKSHKIKALGLKIVAVFDATSTVKTTAVSDYPVYALSKMADLAQRMKIRKAIITDSVTSSATGSGCVNRCRDYHDF